MEDDYDFERDSLASQSSRPTRIRLQEKFRVIQVLDQAETTPADMKKWIEEHARAEMAKAGSYENLPARDTECIGGFMRAHVRLQLLSLFCASHLLISFIVYSIATPCQIGGMVSSECNIIVRICSNATAILPFC
jgi:hypothetical protein